MSVCRECCVLSGRGLCVGLVTRPEESYQVWCVWVWSQILGPPGLLRHGKIKNCARLSSSEISPGNQFQVPHVQAMNEYGCGYMTGDKQDKQWPKWWHHFVNNLIHKN